MRLESQERDLGIFIYSVYMTEDELSEIEEKAFDYWRKEADIPGYRKGMAPKNLIYQKYASRIKETFREILTEKIRQEVSKKHKYEIDSIKIINQRVNENKNLIEIPGQVSKNEIIFDVKVSSKTNIIVDDEEKLKDIVKSVSMVSYTLDKTSVDVEDLAKFFFAGTKIEDSVHEKEKHIVELYIKISDNLPFVNLHLYLDSLPKVADKLKNKKLFEEFELSIDKELGEILKVYLGDMGWDDVDIPSKTTAVLSKVVHLEDSEEVIQENKEVFSKSFGDYKEILPILLDNELYRYNVSRLISKVIAKVISSYKIYVGESEYVSRLLSAIQSTLIDYSFGDLHISSYPINFSYYHNSVFRGLISNKVIEKLYNIFVGHIGSNQRADEVSVKLYEKLSQVCSIQENQISYKYLKDKMQYLFLEFVLK